MAAPFALIAAGGTGGHMFPAQALAEKLIDEGWRVQLSTDERGARYASGFPEAVTRTVVQSATTARGGLAGKLTAPLKIAAGALASVKSFRRDRPNIVIGFGGYPTVPAMTAAWLLGLPRIIHEQNGVMGRVNALFARRVHRVACGTWPTELPSGVNGIHVGNPVRGEVLAKAGSPYQKPGDGPINIIVIGGSQGARVLSDVVPDAAAALPADLREKLSIAHQARSEDQSRVIDAYNAAGISAEVSPFFTDIPRRFAEAQLVISRSGASSIADLTVIGRPSILVPLAAALRDEQTVNAEPLRTAGAAVVMQEAEFDRDSVSREIIAIITDPGRAADMANAALSLGRPDALERLYDQVRKTSQ